VAVRPFRVLRRAEKATIAAEVEDVARFLDRPLALGYET